MKNAFGSTLVVIVIAAAMVTLAAGCAHVPTARQTVAVPAPAESLDLLEVAVAAAKAVGLPPVSKLDKTNGVVEFGSFEAPAAEYAAQVRQRLDGQLDVTVKRGSGSVDEKAKEFVAALDARLQQVPKATPPPARGPAPASPQPPPRRPAATPPAPATPSAPPGQEPPAAPPARPVLTIIVTAPQANVRERADPKAKLVRVVPRNTRLTVLGKAAQWYMVRLADGTEGWVAESVTSPAQ